jgi:segregation and condensation protein B
MKQPELDLCAALECLLFVSREPVAPARLAEALAVSTDALPALVEELSARLENHGLQVLQLAGGYSLATREAYAEPVRLLLEPKPEQLSRQALETLAIVAYKQPLTRPQIEAIRGVNSAGVIRALLDRRLLATAGRDKAAGRPFLFITTPDFLSLFGLADLGDLPSLGEDAAETMARALDAAEADRAGAEPEEEEPPFEFEA